MKDSLVKEKSFTFALKIIRLAQWLRKRQEYELAGQILRSGTSIGANIEEARETHYWLRLLRNSGLLPTNAEAQSLENEREELLRLLTAIAKTATQHLKLKTTHSP